MSLYSTYDNFDQFFLLLSGDVSLNHGPVQISPAVNVKIWEPNYSLFPKFDHTVSDFEVNLPGYDTV